MGASHSGDSGGSSFSISDAENTGNTPERVKIIEETYKRRMALEKERRAFLFRLSAADDVLLDPTVNPESERNSLDVKKAETLTSNRLSI